MGECVAVGGGVGPCNPAAASGWGHATAIEALFYTGGTEGYFAVARVKSACGGGGAALAHGGGGCVGWGSWATLELEGYRASCFGNGH